MRPRINGSTAYVFCGWLPVPLATPSMGKVSPILIAPVLLRKTAEDARDDVGPSPVIRTEADVVAA
jgi:hypothetical protein